MDIDHLHSRLDVEASQHSSAGIKPQNEDSIGIRVPEGAALTTKGIAMVIADGVSAAEAGKEASEACVKGFLSDYYSTPDSWSVKKSAHRVLTALNRWLYGQGQKFIDVHKGYVTTLSVLIIKSQSAYIFHVGDSRIYRYRNGQLELLTYDHIVRISDEQVYLARAMGIDPNLDVDYHNLDVEEGDLFVSTTDGVHDWLNIKEIEGIVGRYFGKPDELPGVLIERALANGSDDNVSCQVLKAVGLGKASDEDAFNKLGELPFPPHLKVGMRIDGLRIIKEIYASQRSQLYLVEDEAAGGLLRVMKTPSINYDDDPGYIERFIMEEWTGLRIDSPHVVKVHKPSQPRTFLYYLVDYLNGPTLAQHIRKQGKLDVVETIGIVEQVAKGLRAFHRKETLHQDLKPGNIVLSQNGAVIIDFGSSFVAGVDEIISPFKPELPLGTLDYSAPEYRLQKARTEKSDQFSLATLAYEMLTGRLPFGDGYQKAHRLSDFTALKYTPAFAYNPLVPVWMDGAINRALSVSQELRYPQLSEFVYDLKHPNSKYINNQNLPVMNKNPVLIWKGMSALLLLTQIVTLVYWLN